MQTLFNHIFRHKLFSKQSCITYLAPHNTPIHVHKHICIHINILKQSKPSTIYAICICTWLTYCRSVMLWSELEETRNISRNLHSLSFFYCETTWCAPTRCDWITNRGLYICFLNSICRNNSSSCVLALSCDDHWLLLLSRSMFVDEVFPVWFLEWESGWWWKIYARLMRNHIRLGN